MKSKIVLISKVYLGIVALFVGYLGLGWAFAIDGGLEKYDITINTIAGLNTVKSIMGTGLISISLFAGLFIVNTKKWYPPMLVMISILLIVRVSSLVMDGFHDRMAIYTGLEVLVLLAVIFTGKNETANPN